MEIELTEDEAIVLFELLHDYGESGDARQLAIRHVAERNALWALSAQLDKRLVAPFQHDYEEQLAVARRRLEERGDSW